LLKYATSLQQQQTMGGGLSPRENTDGDSRRSGKTMNVSVTGGGVLPVICRWSGCVGMYLIYCIDCRARYNYDVSDIHAVTLGVWCAGKSVCVPVARMGGHLVSMPGVGIHPHSHKWESTSISTDAYIGRKCSHRSIAQY